MCPHSLSWWRLRYPRRLGAMVKTPSMGDMEGLCRVVVEGLLPGKPVAHNLGLVSVDFGLLWDIVACHLGLFGFPGRLYMRNSDPG